LTGLVFENGFIVKKRLQIPQTIQFCFKYFPNLLYPQDFPGLFPAPPSALFNQNADDENYFFWIVSTKNKICLALIFGKI
jgi:hypothetical protein